MRTTLNIDDEALSAAMKFAEGQTKTEVINEALRRFARGRRRRQLLKLQAKIEWPIMCSKAGHITLASKQEAIDDFSLQVHAAFQDLLHKRTFETSADEVNQWRTLSEIIDVTVYRNSTPVVVRQFGQVGFGTLPYPSQIHWDNGFTESVHPRQVNSADFVTFKSGQPIEAVVVRNPLTRELIEVSYIARVHSPRTPDEISKAGLAERIGTSADLPDADWE